MNSGARNKPDDWGKELARINARIDEIELRFDAQYYALRGAFDTQIMQLRVALQCIEDDIAADSSDVRAHKVAAQIAELKRKGDVAYDLLQASLRQTSVSKNESSVRPQRRKAPHRQPLRDVSARAEADS